MAASDSVSLMSTGVDELFIVKCWGKVGWGGGRGLYGRNPVAAESHIGM